jgi:hypothetical protein
MSFALMLPVVVRPSVLPVCHEKRLRCHRDQSDKLNAMAAVAVIPSLEPLPQFGHSV